MLPAFDEFVGDFARFIESGRIGKLGINCESGVNTELFNIYRNGYFRSLIDTLVSNYPAVHGLVGDSVFRVLAKQFVVQFPPVSGSLVGYGKEFTSFLDEGEISRELPYLSDMAQLDRGWLEVYFAVDSEPLTPAGITALVNESDNKSLRQIAMVPASRIISLSYPITDIWQLLKDKGALDERIELSRKPEYTLIWRSGNDVLIRKLPNVEYVFLSSLTEGLSIEEAAENAIEEDSKINLGLLISNVIVAGLLATRTSILDRTE